jgi:dsDNA-specific endonuclease/ATPase MutS2
MSLCLYLLERKVSSSINFYREILEPDIFAAHGLHLDDASLSSFHTSLSKIEISDARVCFCGPLSDFNNKMTTISKLSTELERHVIHVKKSKQRGCFVSSQLSAELFTAAKHESDPLWTVEYLPVPLKIHTSVLQYLFYTTRSISVLDNGELISRYKRKKNRRDKLKNKSALSLKEEIRLTGNERRHCYIHSLIYMYI